VIQAGYVLYSEIHKHILFGIRKLLHEQKKFIAVPVYKERGKTNFNHVLEISFLFAS
jgi:hypothetical protein